MGNVLDLDVARQEAERICAGKINCSFTLRYSKYPGCSSNTISLSKVSFGRASKALVSAPGPGKRNEEQHQDMEQGARDCGVPGKASIMIFGAPFAVFPFPVTSSTLRRGFVHLVKASARALALCGLRMETLSRSPTEAP